MRFPAQAAGNALKSRRALIRTVGEKATFGACYKSVAFL
jgi:hypothetical protein